MRERHQSINVGHEASPSQAFVSTGTLGGPPPRLSGGQILVLEPGRLAVEAERLVQLQDTYGFLFDSSTVDPWTSDQASFNTYTI